MTEFLRSRTAALAALCTCLLSTAALADYATVVLADSPVAFYRLGEAQGATVAQDSSGNGEHASYNGSPRPALGRTGLVSGSDTAAEFSGNAGEAPYVLTPPLFNPAVTSWTFELLFRTDGIGQTQAILQQGDGGGTGRTVMSLNASGALNSFVGGSSRPADFMPEAEVAVHVALVFERSGDNGSGEGIGTWRWYVDGVQSASGSFSGNSGVEPSSGPFFIGIHKGVTSQFFDGVIDEVAFYDTALSAGRIAAHAEAVNAPPLIEGFDADPAVIEPGGSATLSWVVADSVTSLEIDNGVGDVLPVTAAGSGSVMVSPADGAVYTLTASDGASTQTATASVAVGGAGAFVINEFLAINGGPVVDEDGEEEDWIEIKNQDVAPADLAGWYLTDDPAVLDKWEFPVTPIPAGGFVLVFASGKDRSADGAEPHTNFKLDSDGEYLALVEPDGVTVHHEFAPAFPQQLPSISYGIEPGAGGAAGYFTNPTPLAENDLDAVAAFVEEPVIADVTRGFFDAPFDVTLSTAAVGADIYYTTDASEPSPTNGTLYSAPVPITTTTTLRAGAFRMGEAPLKIATQTYIFLDDVLDQPTAPAGYPPVWQPSVTADYAMDDDPSIGSPAEIKAALRALPTLSLVMEIDDWFNNSTNSAVGGIYSNSTIARGQEWERKVSAEFFDFPHGQEIQVEAGMRIFGNASRATSRAKHNMRMVFRSAYGPSRLEFPLFGGDAEPRHRQQLPAARAERRLVVPPELRPAAGGSLYPRSTRA